MRVFMESRRRFAVFATAAPAALGFVPLARADSPMLLRANGGDDGITRGAAAIHQEVVFDASRERIFRMLTRAEEFDRVVRASDAAPAVLQPGAPPTSIESAAGTSFTLFGGYVTGRQIEVVPNERIVQTWRAASWPPGAHSLASFILKEEGSRTRIVFDHRAFPDDQAAHLALGWKVNYWIPMAKVLAAAA